MIQDRAYWDEWEAKEVLSQPLDFSANLRLIDSMFEEARLLGCFAEEDPLSGLETKIRLARIMNVCGAPREDRPEA